MGFVTIPSMLADMKSGDDSAWAYFTRYYGPLIWLRGNDYHLTPSEQEELSQDVLVAFFKAQDHFEYKPELGRFRDYLRTVIKHCIFQILRRRQKLSSQTELEEGIAFDENEEAGREQAEEEEWQAHVYSLALEELGRELKPRKLQAFRMCRLENKDPKEVAKFQKVSLATVYNDCNEVMNSLREKIKELSEA